MKCPNLKCGRKIQVADSREKNDGLLVRRRRRCHHCHQAWTTCEIIQDNKTNVQNLQINHDAKPIELYNKALELLGELAKSIGIQ